VKEWRLELALGRRRRVVFFEKHSQLEQTAVPGCLCKSGI
jgi:hypothetical protein